MKKMPLIAVLLTAMMLIGVSSCKKQNDALSDPAEKNAEALALNNKVRNKLHLASTLTGLAGMWLQVP